MTVQARQGADEETEDARSDHRQNRGKGGERKDGTEKCVHDRGPFPSKLPKFGRQRLLKQDRDGRVDNNHKDRRGCDKQHGTPYAEHHRQDKDDQGARRVEAGDRNKKEETRGVCGCPLFCKRNLRCFGRIFDRTCVRPLDVPLMTPRAGLLFGKLDSHRFRELPALEPRV